MKFKTITVAELAKLVGGRVEGDPLLAVRGVSGLDDAREGDLSFLANPHYAHFLETTKAACVIVGEKVGDTSAGRATLIHVGNPDLAFSIAVEAMSERVPSPAEGIHPTAIVAADAKIGAGARIGAYCVVEAGAEVGARTTLFPHCYIGHGSTVGEDCLFYAHVAVYHFCKIGARAIAHSGAVIGSDGFGFAWDGKQHRKIPQVGTVEIGDDVEIGANTTIDRARFGKTVIGAGTKLDNLIQIAHNVEIGPKCAFAAQTGIAGSAKVGAGVLLGGKVAVLGHLSVPAGSVVSACSHITKTFQPGRFTGNPARKHEDFIDEARNVKAIPRLRQKIKELERRLDELEA